VCQHLAGEIDLATAVQRIKVESHRFARHQNNWFKQGDPRIRWIAAGEGAVEEAGRLVDEFLGLTRAVTA
jgi:tRNA dimethylallyltransferase